MAYLYFIFLYQEVFHNSNKNNNLICNNSRDKLALYNYSPCEIDAKEYLSTITRELSEFDENNFFLNSIWFV